jgi:mono/diheme cytochrome c family protein
LLKRIVIGLVVAAAVGVAGFAALAWRPSIDPVSPPAAARFAPDVVMRGAVLAGAGYCATCHTAPDGARYAGGYAMRTGFGTIYSTNITPDVATGIGSWSEAAFRRALREGVARDGSHLFPAFPYDHFAKLSDDDIDALYAYFMTRAPVSAPAHPDELPFPLGFRPLQAGWKLLFFHPTPFAPDGSHDAAWNRGAYLAVGVSHCGACHTPRNGLGAEIGAQMYAGAVVDGWTAPPLTDLNPTPVPWTEDELYAYLRTGISRYHGTSAGPMAPVVRDGLSQLPDSDIHALATYFADLGGAASRQAAIQPAVDRALAAEKSTTGPQADPTVRLYVATCASCHYNGGGRIDPLRPEIALNTALSLDDPTNLIRVVLFGISAHQGAPGLMMPGFGRRLGDADIARLLAYLRASRTSLPPWPNLETTVAAVRAAGSS